MRRTLILLCLGALARAEERAFLETETARDTYFVQEPITLRLRIGFDREYFKTNVVQMFQQDFDVPVQVQAPWIEKLAGTEIRKRSVPKGPSFALNGAAAVARRVDDRARYSVLEIERTYVPTRPGELVIPAPRLRFVYGTQFQEDFINGRVATDRRDAFVEGESLTLTIRALPAAGRSSEFSGAVGRFEVRAEAAPRSVQVGAILKLVFRIEGEGNLEFFDTPRLDGLVGFHVYGMMDDRGSERRTITYDVAPLNARVTEVPPIPFVFFDPLAPATYRTVRTRPIPLTVRPAPGAPPPRIAAPPDDFPVMLVAVPLLVLLGAVALMRRMRAQRAAEREPGAADLFHERAAADLAVAFTEYVAARLDCPPASVITPDLSARLEAAGVPADLAARTATLLESLVAARYGGAASDARAEAGTLVAELTATDGKR